MSSEILGMFKSQFKCLEDNYYMEKIEKNFIVYGDVKVRLVMKRKNLALNVQGYGEVCASKIIFTAKVLVEPHNQTVIDAVEKYFLNAGSMLFGELEKDFYKVKINGKILFDQSC